MRATDSSVTSRLQHLIQLQSCFVLFAFGASAVSQAADTAARNTVGDVVALTICVIDADIRFAVLSHKLRGAAYQEVLEATEKAMPDRAYRKQAERIVKEVYESSSALASGTAPRPYVAQKLKQCVMNAAARVQPDNADGCYQLTRYANNFFAAKQAGVSLENTQASIEKMIKEQGLSSDSSSRLTQLAQSVYQTSVAAPEFRSGLFFHCVTPR